MSPRRRPVVTGPRLARPTGRAGGAKMLVGSMAALAGVLLAGVTLLASRQAGDAGRSQAPRCGISGAATSGTARLPGVVITVTPRTGGAPSVTSTGLDGVFVVEVLGPGVYELKAELAAFAPVVREVSLETSCHAKVELAMTLASRTPAAAPATAPAGAAAGAPAGVPAPAAPPTLAVPAGRRPLAQGQFQRVAPVADRAGAQAQEGAAGVAAAEQTETIIAHLSLPPGFSPDTLSSLVTASGSGGQMNEMLLFGGMRGEGPFGGREGMAGEGVEGRPGTGEAGGFGGLPGGAPGGFGGAPGGPGGGPGGMGGRGGGPGMLGQRLEMAGRLRNNRPTGQLSYTVGGSPLDARPYSLTGQPTEKPGYMQHRIAASIGGQLKIPKVFDAGPRMSFFFNYNGNHSSRAYDAYSTVPSLALRSGDFSALGVTVIDPATGQPFPGNRIPADRLSPAALALLQYVPEPNQPGDRQNLYYATTTPTSSDDFNVRLVRTFGAATQRPGGRGMLGGGPGGGPGGGRGGGGMGGGTNLNVGVRYRRSSGSQNNPFPTISGTNTQTGWDIPVNVNFSRWRITHSVRFGYNRNQSKTLNRFAYVDDVAGRAGILGVSTDPFAYGAPSLSFSSISGLRDINPSERMDRAITLGLTSVKMKGRQSIRWGVDFRDSRVDSRSDSNPRGAFVFTGLHTGGGTTRQSWLDFADFLLGLPQQATEQYGPGLVRLRARSWSLFLQDDWRVSSTFTINAGLRYEYQSPYTEASGQLVNLDVAPGFSAAVPVVAGQAGPFTGRYPSSVLEPDRNNVAPRVGVAWRPQAKTIVRGGYGINYSSVPYLGVAQKLASQPPFAVTDTRLGTVDAPLLLTNAFGASSAAETKNNFAIDRAYQIGWVQIWNLDIQRELGRTFSAGIAYTGTKGSSLDILRAPNRGPTGLRIEGVQPFIWESSGGESIMHGVSLRLRRRLAQGFSGGATYTFAKSMDNASSIGGGGGGGGVVAQNDQDLASEWGLSSFDQRHRLTADLTIESPFGPGHKWLAGDGLAGTLLGGWFLSGTISVASGNPFTARVVGDAADVAKGTNGTLRADYTGAPIAIANPTIAQFFNTAAFAFPVSGTFGNAGRNTIVGPGSKSMDMSLMKSFPLRGTRGLSLRVQAGNVLNAAVYSSIDTVVNSPTFGQVVAVRPMRSVQVIARVMF